MVYDKHALKSSTVKREKVQPAVLVSAETETVEAEGVSWSYREVHGCMRLGEDILTSPEAFIVQLHGSLQLQKTGQHSRLALFGQTTKSVPI